MKAHLDPIDKIKAAYFYHVRGIDQNTIAEMLECTNAGRVCEAIKHIEKAIGINGGGYKDK